jgi:small subunit ribosomal protein S5
MIKMEREINEEEGEIIKEIPPEEVGEEIEEKKITTKDEWEPKTNLGRKVKNGEIKDIDEILNNGLNIIESEIVDVLLPDFKTDLLLIGQSKGKFGGGQRRVFKQTQKKTQEGNKPNFATIAVIGNEDGYVGVGYGKSKETVPAREKAIRKAKLNIMKIIRGCGSWQCGCGFPHSIPFKIVGKCGSVIIEIYPAPKGTGLRIEKECQKILKMAGIKDVWSKTFGQTKTKINIIYACINALRDMTRINISHESKEKLGFLEGRLNKEKVLVENG